MGSYSALTTDSKSVRFFKRNLAWGKQDRPFRYIIGKQQRTNVSNVKMNIAYL